MRTDLEDRAADSEAKMLDHHRKKERESAALKTVAHGLDDALHRLDALADEARARRQALDAWLATQPQTTVCERHGHTQAIDPDESSRQSHAAGNFVVVYAQCPDCLAAKRRADSDRRFSEMGIPSMLRGATLDELVYDTEQARVNLEHCRQYAANPRGFLLLLGSVGTGKSHIAAAILQRHGRGLFVTQSQLLALHRQTYGNCLALDIKGRCQSTALLVIDEAGVSVGGRDEGPLLYDILSYRYSEKRPTIVTSNLKPEELPQALGERIVDRIREASFAILHFREPSKRRASNGSYLGE